MASRNIPLVSVIIPTYNHAHFLKKCLASVIAQTLKHWEAIVVNNYSNDETIDVVKSLQDSRIHLVNFHNHGIIAASRNEGIRLAQGDYIAFLDSDDWWYPRKLEVAVKYFFNSADIVFHNLDIYMNGKFIKRSSSGRHLTKPAFVDLMRNGNALLNSSVVVRKSIINDVGGLVEEASLVTTEDFDLWLRISKITDRFVYIPKRLGGYWIDGKNMSEISEKRIESIKSVYLKHLGALEYKDRKESEMLLSYTIGRIKQKRGLLDDAQSLFKESIKLKKLEFKLKSIYFFVFIYFIQKKKKLLSLLSKK